jgi:hypothetical protein
MPELRIAHCPASLHAALKRQAIREGRSLKTLCVRVLTAYLMEAEHEERAHQVRATVRKPMREPRAPEEQP